MKVAIAAPSAPNFGMKIRLKTILIIAPAAAVTNDITVFFASAYILLKKVTREVNTVASNSVGTYFSTPM